MRYNRSIFEISKGEWAFHIPSLSTWLPTVVSLLEGKSINLPEVEQKAVVNFITPNGQVLDSERVLTGEYRGDVVGFVNCIGPMFKYSDLCTKGADRVVLALQMLNGIDQVRSIILNIDGPGGSVSAVSLFQEFASQKQKPIVALVDLCASAHYYAACLVSDHIMASNSISAQIGSIGVMISFADNRKYLEEKGYVFHEIYAPESQHKNEAFKLAREGNYDLIQEEMLSPTAQKFQNAVRQARPNLVEATGVLTGKTFEAEKALEYGMIDSIGNLQKAVQVAMMLAETKSVTQ